MWNDDNRAASLTISTLLCFAFKATLKFLGIILAASEIISSISHTAQRESNEFITFMTSQSEIKIQTTFFHATRNSEKKFLRQIAAVQAKPV